jgi:predicted Fe-Mo cluster-binding NifX family protein
MKLKINAKLDPGYMPMSLVCREMRAATAENGQDLIIAIERNKGYTTTYKTRVYPDGTGHDELGIWLVRNAVNAVICSDIGPGAQGALAAAGIFVFAGIEGPADEAIADLLAGKLTTAKSATCRCRAHAGGCGSDACGGCGSRGCPTHA